MTMSLMVSVSDGIVLASDSRLSYTANGAPVRVLTDANHKLWQLDDFTGINTAGNNVVNGNTIHWHMHQLRVSTQSPNPNWVPTVVDYFQAQFLHQVTQDPWSLIPRVTDPSPLPGEPEERLKMVADRLFFLIASMDGWSRQAAKISLPSGKVEQLFPNPNQPFNLNLIGRHDVITRLINGYDSRLLPLVPGLFEAAKATGIPYAVPFNAMTLQDAIDFAAFAIRATATIQRFVTSTINAQQVHHADVGGSIDIIALSPDGAAWITKKELHLRSSFSL